MCFFHDSFILYALVCFFSHHRTQSRQVPNWKHYKTRQAEPQDLCLLEVLQSLQYPLHSLIFLGVLLGCDFFALWRTLLTGLQDVWQVHRAFTFPCSLACSLELGPVLLALSPLLGLVFKWPPEFWFEGWGGGLLIDLLQSYPIPDPSLRHPNHPPHKDQPDSKTI